MEYILTGRNFTAQQAESWGLVSRVFPADKVVNEAIQTASEIAEFSPIAVKAAKELVNEGYQMNLDQGLKFERRVFHSLFGTNDQKEGMAAFAEKRKPEFTGE
jgi:enoyl-CoA hydratase